MSGSLAHNILAVGAVRIVNDKISFMIHEKVKKILEAKGWDFSSDYFDDEELKSINEVIDATIEALRQPPVMYQLKGNYTEHFLEWRNRLFEADIEINEWKTKNKGTRFTTAELHKYYEKAMLQSPFNNT